MIKTLIRIIFLRIFLYLIFLELFLRIGSLVSGSLQNVENERVLHNKNAYRIMCIGESTTFSGGKDSYPSQLENILNERRTNKVFEVINRGIPGSNSADIVSGLKKDIELYKPNMVIAMVGINDTNNTIIYKDTSANKLRILIGDIRTLRVFKFLWSHVKEEVLNWLQNDNTENSVEKKLRWEITRHPKSSGPYIELGQYLTSQKEYNEAEKLFRKAVKINPKKDWGYQELAKTLILQGRFSEAEAVFTDSLKKNPTRSWAYTSLSRFYISQNRNVDAENILNTGIKKTPKDVELLLEKGNLSCSLKKFDKADQEFQYAASIAPEMSKVYTSWGLCYGEQMQFDRMDQLFNKALIIDRKTLTLNLGEVTENVLITLADWYVKHKNPNRAESILKNELLQNPEDSRVIRALSKLYFQTGQMELANQFQSKANELNVSKPLLATSENYKKIAEIAQKEGAVFVSISYASRDIEPLRQLFGKNDSILFVDNGEIFRKAIKSETYDEYFTDNFAGDFGHFTPKGANLMAQNVADTIFKYLPKQ